MQLLHLRRLHASLRLGGLLVHLHGVRLKRLLLREQHRGRGHRLREGHGRRSRVVEGLDEGPEHQREGLGAQVGAEDLLRCEPDGEDFADVVVDEADEVSVDVCHGAGPRCLLDFQARVWQAVTSNAIKHPLQRLGRAVLNNLIGIHMLVQVLVHLLLALLHRPVVLKIRPISDEEVQRLERLLDVARLLGAALHSLPKCRLGEGHEVCQVLYLVFLNLHVDVVDLLGGD
mmetsp:Transcript_80005/g.232289  ORF Transcript_80005/g.232289 Transcript_80005/m.232289 type:complete len:230 (-) Transcript_80005:646-1335(-)